MATNQKAETAPEVALAGALAEEPSVSHTEASEKQRADVLKEYQETGRVREGFAYSRQWPELVRKISKES